MAGKSGKTYGDNHLLVVVVDDYLSFRTEADKAVLLKSAKSIASSLRLDFGAVYLLGSTGKYSAHVCLRNLTMCCTALEPMTWVRMALRSAQKADRAFCSEAMSAYVDRFEDAIRLDVFS